MKHFIVDASVAIKWVVQENYQPEALQYLNASFNLTVPSIMLIECATAIQNHVRLGKMSEKDGWEAYQELRNMQFIAYVSSEELIHWSFRIANEIHHALYDCLYLALALREQAMLVTADKKFHDRVKTGAYGQHVVWVEEQPQ